MLIQKAIQSSRFESVLALGKGTLWSRMVQSTLSEITAAIESMAQGPGMDIKFAPASYSELFSSLAGGGGFGTKTLWGMKLSAVTKLEWAPAMKYTGSKLFIVSYTPTLPSFVPTAVNEHIDWEFGDEFTSKSLTSRHEMLSFRISLFEIKWKSRCSDEKAHEDRYANCLAEVFLS